MDNSGCCSVPNVTCIVPTYNGRSEFLRLAESLKNQDIKFNLLVVDSSSVDGTAELAGKYTSNVIVIPSREFNHGGTRNLAARYVSDSDILIFLTQDACFTCQDSLLNLLRCFDDPVVAAVCGRQLPHDNANPLAVHARMFNYPLHSEIKSSGDIPRLGIKTAFMSNSFAAYRTSVFNELGGFPNNTILAEDMFLTAKMIQAGYKVSYCAEASVKHSHNYTPWEEFCRYFDTGVFHACEPWIQQEFGGAGGEGMRYIRSEFSYLLKNAPGWIPRALITNACKLVGYKLGRNYQKLPIWLRPKLSMYKSYWLQQSSNS